MRTPPSTTYSGLTIIIDEPSRFDKEYSRLCSGSAGDWLDSECLPDGYKLASNDLRDISCSDSFLPNTRKVLLLGAKAAAKFSARHDPPGYPAIVSGIPAISAFYPQDCCDHKNLRASDKENEAAVSDRDTKEVTPTLFRNHRFWTKYHIRKFLSPQQPCYPPIDPLCYPRLDVAIKTLDSCSGNLYLDIETSRVHRCLTCIGFSTDEIFPKILVVPVYLAHGELAYRDFHRFYKALSLALSRSTVVIHNAMFDLLVLHGFYKTCLPASVYDTMVAQHRCFPEAEKSLGHTISAWTSLPYHKDTNTEVYSYEDEKRLWIYNARDVYALKLIKDAQLGHASLDLGLLASIEQGNASVIPYLSTSLTGLRLDLMKLAATQRKLLAHKNLYGKIASILTGTTFNPGSSQQCAEFFHKKLNYPVISKTSKGAPAIGSKQLYQLQLKHNNPLIPVILKYREVAKDASMLESELFTLP